MDDGSSKHAVGGDAQGPVQWEPNGGADLKRLARKDPGQKHCGTAQDGHGPSGFELGKILCFNGVSR